MDAPASVRQIIDAGLLALADGGPDGASVRGIADRAGLPAATLQHHFPTKQMLLRAIYKRAVERHASLTESVTGAFAADGAPDAASEDIASTLLRAWLDRDAAATAAVLHLLAHAVRDAAYAEAGRSWVSRSLAALAAPMRVDADRAAFTLECLVGVALASPATTRRVELDLLDAELLAFAFAARTASAGGWLAHYRRGNAAILLGPAPDGVSGGVARAVLGAGIEMMAESGADALSYRKIALRAGVAPSSVLYNFPSRQDLLMAIYREIHRRFTSIVPAAKQADPTPDGIAATFTEMIVGQKAGTVPLVLATCELFLAGWRDEELAGQAWAMRLSRGLSAEAIASDRAGLLAHLLSLWSTGLSLVQLSTRPDDPAAAVNHRLRRGLAIADLR